MAAPTEMSYLWTTGGAGDGAATYTVSDWHKIVEIVGCCHGEEGVGDFENHYDATFAANTVTIDTGMGISDGKPHHCSVAGDITIPSAVGGGNTRIDRIVLRADWTAQTVRLTRIAGTDAASPTAPAITQTSETTYDIMLYQVLVDTGGTTSLQADERVWAAAGLAGNGLVTNTSGGMAVNVDGSTIEISSDALRVKDGGIVLAKMAADSVDDSKAGNRVPALTRRQGGSATVWTTQGTTTYTPAAVRIQAGSRLIASTGTVTFPVAFSYAPIVIAIVDAVGDRLAVTLGGVTSTQVAFNVWNDAGTGGNGTVYWMAIGPE